MKPKVFLEFIEITSLIASVFPFVLGVMYAYYNYHTINVVNTILFFIAANLLQMAVNANDNYQDFIHSDDDEEFKSQTNVVGVNNISITTARTITYSLAGIVAVIGLYLVTRVGLPLLWLGLFSFAVGYFYAAGPRPISNTPFGEIFSGVTMGFIIFLIAAFVNVYSVESLNFSFLWRILLASGIAIFAISNIMLANNICDEQEDKRNNRRTAVFYFGKKVMLRVFALSYVAGYLCLIVAILIGVLPWLSILTLLSIPFVWHNVHVFFQNQVKRETFVLSVKNSVTITMFFTIAMGAGIWLNL
ncbi:1,4-dihydroxy-2-naphthoate octaprenyltransferase [Paucilactobacillus hokkaidonensis JCM 18461]|uniref:1,4-dihydroxy-2-naphthoate octaprenyltransferase n=1 Tax=Paucilactobacillus hokkaidonensis JCM 18461 TaxID=1291742 RepID=A0A0A1GT86_9LACO|nr:1,4-dihydroxy-2-naphthoate polyprenyltransferase [Paucilactobacillus hokkaidonensis]BAP85170.1 1,4-dihydroxy-2-naphthoate octaprenyltransferase [Paucilactobacillus hokkaidonensis JCM 18461]